MALSYCPYCGSELKMLKPDWYYCEKCRKIFLEITFGEHVIKVM